MELIKFKKLGIEVDFEQNQNEKKFDEIIIPKGWRMLRLCELEEVMNYIVEHKLDIGSYFEQPINQFKRKYVARFWAISVGAGLYCYGDPGNSDSSLGVIFCRDIK